MKFKISVPSKTFLLGEYLVLDGGPGLLINTSPRFHLLIDEANQTPMINDENIFDIGSPAFLYFKKYQDDFKNLCLEFFDPYCGQGGFGASSSQFLMLMIYKHYRLGFSLDINKLLNEYKALIKNNRYYKPSGVDIISQIYGGLLYFSLNDGIINKFAWPFFDLSFALIHSQNKVPTHEHLKNLTKIDFRGSEKIVKSGINCVKKKDAIGFCESINCYREFLKNKGLVHPKTQLLLDEIKKYKVVLASKGCGALGADVIFALLKNEHVPKFLTLFNNSEFKIMTVGQRLSSGFDVETIKTKEKSLDELIIVDHQDRPVGLTTKLHAHKNSILHRAFSIFIFRFRNNLLEILLQKRAKNKYHSGSLWSNSCCGHAKPGEDTLITAIKRLKDELGIMCSLYEIGVFRYYAKVNHGLSENEIDHVFVGNYDDIDIHPNPDEVEDYSWMTLLDLLKDINNNPKKYTPWIKGALDLILREKVIDSFYKI